MRIIFSGNDRYLPDNEYYFNLAYHGYAILRLERATMIPNFLVPVSLKFETETTYNYYFYSLTKRQAGYCRLKL